MIGPLFNLEGRYHFSLVEWFAHYYEDVFGDLVYLTDGADGLTTAFEPYLGDDIRYGAEVHAVAQTESKVTVHFKTSAGTRNTMHADECIITTPLSLLRHMEIERLDPQKWQAIRNSYYGRAHKIFMQFSTRWWETQYDITHGQTVTDLAIRNVVYPPAGQDPDIDKGVIIASYCWEQDSIPYSAMPEEERMVQVLEDLSKIHPEARATFEHGISKDWAADRFAGGIPCLGPSRCSATRSLTSSGRCTACGSPATHAIAATAAGRRARCARLFATSTRSTSGCATRSRGPGSGETPPTTIVRLC